MNMTLKKQLFTASLLCTVFLMSSCQKNDYFEDTGRHTANFQGTVFDYLNSRPGYFDSVVKVIQLAGLENVLKQEDITFFAPADSSIKSTIEMLNVILRSRGIKEVTNLNQIKPEVWRQQLSRYIFKGKKSMNDFPQIDPGNLSAYPGQIYASYDGLIMNVGVIYNDAGGVRYAGYRQMMVSYIPSPSAPRDYNSWYPSIVATVNIAPTNGYVHVLTYSYHRFGFDVNQFIDNAIAKGID
jgi:hypothetical protein